MVRGRFRRTGRLMVTLAVLASTLVAVAAPGREPKAQAALGAPSIEGCLWSTPCYERVVDGQKYTFSWSPEKQQWGFIGYVRSPYVLLPGSGYTRTEPVPMSATCWDDPVTGLYELRTSTNPDACVTVPGVYGSGYRGCWAGVMQWGDPTKPHLPCIHTNIFSRDPSNLSRIDAQVTCGYALACGGGHNLSGYYWGGHSEMWNTLQWGWVPCARVMDPNLCAPPPWTTTVSSPPITVSMKPRNVTVTTTPTSAIPVGGTQRITTATSVLEIEDCTLWVTGTGVIDTGPNGVPTSCAPYADLMPQPVYGPQQQLSVVPVGVTACATQAQSGSCHYYLGPEQRYSVGGGTTPPQVVQRKIYAYRASGPGQGLQISTTAPDWPYIWATKTIPTSTCTLWHAWLPPDGAHASWWQMDYPLNQANCTYGGTVGVTWNLGVLTPRTNPTAPVLLPLLNPTATPTGN